MIPYYIFQNIVIQKEKQVSLHKKITQNKSLMLMYSLRSLQRVARYEITADFKHLLKVQPASSCGYQVINTWQRETSGSADKKTKKWNQGKTKFLLVYSDGTPPVKCLDSLHVSHFFSCFR